MTLGTKIEGCTGFVDGSVANGFRVGAKAPGYDGPVADISFDETWLHIETDPYEGVVMLNIEALPSLIAALRAISDKIALA